MSNDQIPNLPGVFALGDGSLFEVVQAGVSSKVTSDQMATYVITKYPFPLPPIVDSWSAGVTGLTPIAPSTGDIVLGGTLVVGNGGTGVATLTQNGVLLGNGTGALNATAVGLTAQFLIGNTGADPSWANISTTLVSSLSFGTTGLTPNSATTGAITVAGVLASTSGGTGFNAYTVGDILYANTTTSLNILSDVATGNALISGGIGVAPSWGKISLTTAVSGMLPVANGGSGAAAFTAHGVLLGNAASAFNVTAVGSTGQILTGNTGADPTWANATSVAVTTISFGTTGLTPNSATAGAVTVAGTLVAANGGTGQASFAIGDLLYADTTTSLARLADVATANVLLSGGINTAPAWGKVVLTTAVSGVLPVANGGIGVGTLTGIPLGNGTSAFTVATAGTDYAKPNTASTWTALQTFNGSTSVLAAVLANAAETTTISATAATGTINYDLTTQSIIYYTSNASADWTPNFRASSGTTLNAALATGQTITAAFLVTQGATAFKSAAVQVDGTSSGVAVKWQGGSAPGAGDINSIDAYVYSIVKTGSAAYTIFASMTKYA